MRKKYVLFISFIIILFSCKEQNRHNKLETKEIEIQESQIFEIDESDEQIEKDEYIETFLDIKIMFPDKKVVEKRDVNLDLDTAIEQYIILVDINMVITIVVADFNKITREYFVAWSYELTIIYNSDFSMVEQDVLAYQHNLELVISGTTINNNNALFIFRKTAPPKGVHIYYKSIFAKESSGSVEIITNSRSLDYNESRKNTDDAYDILVEKTNVINENTIAVIKENWAWDKRRNSFIKESSDRSEIKINVKEKLRTIFEGSKANFLDFVSGEWMLDSDISKDMIMIIDSSVNKIIFKYEDGVEEYDIQKIWSIYQKLTIKLENSDINTIPEQITITLISTDEISITKKTPDTWVGNYTRLNTDNKNSLISKVNTDIIVDVPFTGIYKNVAYTINFSYPKFEMTSTTDGTVQEGIFSLLELSNCFVLQLKAKGELRSNYNITNYKLSFNEQALESQVIRTIKLHKGQLTTHGIEVKSDLSPIKFEQTEVLNSEQ